MTHGNSCIDPKSNKKSGRPPKNNPLSRSDVLKLIVFGHRHDAHRLLAKKPELLCLENDVMDYSGRIFKPE